MLDHCGFILASAAATIAAARQSRVAGPARRAQAGAAGAQRENGEVADGVGEGLREDGKSAAPAARPGPPWTRAQARW
ncbi:hypothetical protein D0T25_25045 [Duganella sp. BJB488]|nr:hypothetical protein D0T26_24110 [Duganella sp. BJB489]RFP16531.1 hypothetical protein D0T25_25045 [Duganella sp. BJB488]RFP30739.1 hypothetical protein D0T24_25455 [Duganella sp. BJB480]